MFRLKLLNIYGFSHNRVGKFNMKISASLVASGKMHLSPIPANGKIFNGSFTQTKTNSRCIPILLFLSSGKDILHLWRFQSTDHHARLSLKKLSATSVAKQTYSAWYDKRLRRVRDFFSGETRIYLEIEIRRVLCRHYDKVKRERLDFLANNLLCTKRFAWYVGR